MTRTEMGDDNLDLLNVGINACGEMGLDNLGGSPHSWRCEYPDRYPDYCKCATEVTGHVLTSMVEWINSHPEELPKMFPEAIRYIQQKTWEEGFDAGERDAYRPIDHETCIPNPYRNADPSV